MAERWRIGIFGFLGASSLVLASPQKSAAPAKTQAPFARAQLEAKSGSEVTGSVELTVVDEGLQISAMIVGAKPGKHGIHVHEKGDCKAADASSAGEHFNPAHARHGGLTSLSRHVGDLGNILVTEDGKGTLLVTLPAAKDKKASQWDDFLGKAVIVHANEDDLRSQPAGDSGDRIACGVIEKVAPTHSR
jgi:superoxide dismutase, Cu-Zn family